MNAEEIIKLDLMQKSPEELLEYFPYEPEIDEHVYDTLVGQLIPQCQLPWVKPIFVPGHKCYAAYSQMLDAYWHLCERLGQRDEDADGEIMINSLLEYGRIVA